MSAVKPFSQPTPNVSTAMRGFTLVEVMLAMFVLSLGLLGLAGMQLGGMQSTKSAYSRSQATEMAYSIIDRMRTNSNGRANYQDVDCSNTTTNPGCIGTSTGCNATNLATDDIYEWCNKSIARLPGGSGTVTYNTTSTVYTVTVGWTEQSDTDNPNKSIVVNLKF